MKEEIAYLMETGHGCRAKRRIDQPGFLLQRLKTFEAVYLGLDSLPGRSWQIEEDGQGNIRIEPSNTKHKYGRHFCRWIASLWFGFANMAGD